MVVGASRFQRFTTPARVPMANGGNACGSVVSLSVASSECFFETGSMAIAVTTCSPRIGSVLSVCPISSSAFTPLLRLSVFVTGTTGRSATCASTSRPADVISA